MQNLEADRSSIASEVLSGGGGIRTHGALARPTVFKTVPFDRSGTPPNTESMGLPGSRSYRGFCGRNVPRNVLRFSAVVTASSAPSSIRCATRSR